ncbi:cation-translocating P-type ATPase [Uliginosibacterium sp. H3]|uniref:Cation-translocating P-type ATPase n=1 Tax=Uliginosibacterium silvisoli TaxID=3114758 RepID=A0ABU6K0E5_9RHOO|nr:cation-translocating P-type ATPase [Uliginosibacterium sp. H3]
MPADTVLDPPLLSRDDASRAPLTPRAPGAAPAGDYRALDVAEVQAQFSRPTGTPHQIESWLLVEGMTCTSCAQGIERRLAARPGVISVDVNAAAGRARLVWDAQQVRLSTLFADIAALDYRPFPVQQIGTDLTRRDERRKALWRLFVAGFCMMQVMMYAAPAYFAEPGDLTPDMERLLKWASCVMSLPVLLFAATPFFSSAWRDLQARRVGMDVPVALGIVITFVASTASLLHPGGEAYFDSLTMFVFFLLGGRYLETLARGKAASSLESLTTRLPDSVERFDDWPTAHAGEHVVLHQLRVGDVLRVAVGQAFPADGVVLAGSSAVDEALLTGEARPIARQAGDAVVAGSYNLEAPLVMRVERLGAQSRFGEIVALMARAASEKPRLAALADRYASSFLIAVLLLAALAGIAWSFVDPARAVWVAVSVLVVTCPCALSLATPAAVLATSGLLARRGVLVSHPAALEALAGAGRVVFDKTGTLTHEQLALVALECLREGMGRDRVLALAMAMDAGSLHPVARALQRVALPECEAPGLTAVREVRGAGVEAVSGEHVYRLGSAAFAWPQWADRATHARGGVTVLLADERGPIAVLRFDEHLRDDACASVAALRAQQVEVSVLSGDRDINVRTVAAWAGIDDARGAQTPEDKLAVVTAWQSGSVPAQCIVMVGDGINDGPVLSRADVSIVMGSGAPLSQSDADLVLLSNRLADVPLAIAEARRMGRVIKQNIFWAAGYNLICVPLALFGLLPPWLAGLGMASSSLLVVLNALRLARPAVPLTAKES